MKARIEPPRSWGKPELQLLAGLTNDWYRAVTQLTAQCIRSTHLYHEERGHVPVLMPVTTGAVSSPMGLGSDSLPVSVELFNERVFLADSMQFQLEYLLRQGYNGVFYIMPTFRGEDPDDTHLNQFFHAEAELLGGLDDVIDHVDGFVRRLTQDVLASPSADLLERSVDDLGHLAPFTDGREIPRVAFDEAVRQLHHSEELIAFSHASPSHLRRSGERRLIEIYGGAVWVTHPPASSVPFYQATDNDGSARAADLLFGIGEVVGCGERHVSGESVLRALEAHRVDAVPYDWYVSMKQAVPVRTAGFGLGLERYLMWLLQHDDIRDLQVLPRLKSVPHSV